MQLMRMHLTKLACLGVAGMKLRSEPKKSSGVTRGKSKGPSAAAAVLQMPKAKALITKYWGVVDITELSRMISKAVFDDESHAKSVRFQLCKRPQPVRGRTLREEAESGSTADKRACINKMTTHMEDLAQALERRSRGDCETARVVAVQAQEAIRFLADGNRTTELLDLRSAPPPSSLLYKSPTVPAGSELAYAVHAGVFPFQLRNLETHTHTHTHTLPPPRSQDVACTNNSILKPTQTNSNQLKQINQ